MGKVAGIGEGRDDARAGFGLGYLQTIFEEELLMHPWRESPSSDDRA